jgi:DNA-binding transcriptional ArsR family regulator
MDQQRINLVADEAKKAMAHLRAIAHPMRKKIITMLFDKGEMNVTQIYVKLRCEQSVASQQLAILKKSNLVDARREGHMVYYSANKARLLEILGHAFELNKPVLPKIKKQAKYAN